VNEIEYRMTSKEWNAVRADPAFHQVLALCRFVNTIRFVELAIFSSPGQLSPSGIRQTTSGVFYLAGIMKEARDFATRLGQHFRGYSSYSSLVLPLINDPAIDQLYADVLKPMRNEAVFHYDLTLFSTTAPQMNANRSVFESAQGPPPGDQYDELAELVVLSFA
jgi:hypothetical protein